MAVAFPLDRMPEYSWCAHDPESLGAWAPTGLNPVDPVGAHDLPDSAPATVGDLIAVEQPSIRTLSVYFHAGWPHSGARTWVRPQTCARLQDAVQHLPDGFGLAIWDAWRDPRLQAVLHDTVYQDATLAPGFVAYPDPDPRHAPPHATGGTVDLTLTWRGYPLALGTGFDAFVDEAGAAALEPNGPAIARDLRRLLASVMSKSGFVVHPQEWWHWEYGTRFWSAVTGEPVRYGLTRPA